jgi:hypothetical protein
VFQYLLAPADPLSNSPTCSPWGTPIDGSVTQNFSYGGIGGDSKASSQNSADQDQESYAPTLYMESLEERLEGMEVELAALRQRVERLEGMEVELAALRVCIPSELFFNLVNRVAIIEARWNLRAKG